MIRDHPAPLYTRSIAFRATQDAILELSIIGIGEYYMLVQLLLAGGACYVGVRSVIRHRQGQTFLRAPHHAKNKKLIDYWPTPSLETSLSKDNQRLMEPGSGKSLAERKKEANHFLKASTLALGLNLAGWIFYPPLIVLSAPVTLYAWYPLLRYGYYGLKNKKLNVGIVDAFLVFGLLALNKILLAIFTVWTLNISERVLVETEEDSHAKLVNLFGEQPQFVWIRVDEVDVQVPFDSLQIGDVVVVHPSETVPVDGLIVKGVATIDQRMLTGESQPVEKGEGDQVFASTIVLSGQLWLKVEKTGQETVAAQIGQILNQTADFRASVSSQGRKVADDYALLTLVLAGIAWPLLGASSAVAALVASFGYNLRVISPISVLNFLQVTSKNGILIKDGRSLELLRQVNAVVFDKTGTLTIEQPHVEKIHLFRDFDEDELLTYAAAAEYKQTHPIAKAILAAAQERELALPAIDEAAYEVGYGIKVKIDSQLIRVGSLRFMRMEQLSISPEMEAIQESCHDHGYSLVYVAIDQQLYGAIELHPAIRPEAKSLIKALKERGLSLYIISGDHTKPTQKLAQELGIDNYFAEILPEGKADIVEQLQQQDRFVCFIGDGINDSIALKKANVSISLSGATTIATDTAQLILMDGELTKLDFLFEIAAAYEQNKKQNLLATMVPAVICVGGVFFLHFGVLSGVLLYNIGLAIGVTNAMSPLLLYAPDKNQLE